MLTDKIFYVLITNTFTRIEIGIEIELNPKILDIVYILSVPEFLDLFL